MRELFLVGLGGFLGAAARYQCGVWMTSAVRSQRLPWGTLAVNLTGCLLIGLLAGLAEKRAWPGDTMRLFLVTGILGGYTTFSAFGLETVNLLRNGHAPAALGYAAASLAGGLAAVWLGMKLA